jgi:hypothetical protein
METMNEREILKEELTEALTEHYTEQMEAFAEGGSAFHILPQLLLEGMDGTAPDRYRNSLECETFGRSLADYLHDGSCRETLLELTRGSVLGEVLPEVFAYWDQEITREDSAEMLGDLLQGVRDHIDEAREALRKEISDETSDVETLVEDLLFNNDSMNRS